LIACGDPARDFRLEIDEGVGADRRGPHVSDVRGGVPVREIE
jgi:hypothetical protein